MPATSAGMTAGRLSDDIEKCPGCLMRLFRYSTSIYGGSDVLIGASWDLLKWFVVAGVVVIVLHAAIKAVASRRADRAS